MGTQSAESTKLGTGNLGSARALCSSHSSEPRGGGVAVEPPRVPPQGPTAGTACPQPGPGVGTCPPGAPLHPCPSLGRKKRLPGTAAGAGMGDCMERDLSLRGSAGRRFCQKPLFLQETADFKARL